MQTLVFNTTTKTIVLYSDVALYSKVIYSLENIPTVRVSQDGFYEVIQESNNTKYPVLRFPISNTNMEINK